MLQVLDLRCSLLHTGLQCYIGVFIVTLHGYSLVENVQWGRMEDAGRGTSEKKRAKDTEKCFKISNQSDMTIQLSRQHSGGW